MSSYPQQPGLTNRIWVGGRALGRDPVPVTLTPKRFEQQTRMSNSGLTVDRLYIAPGFPNVQTRVQIGLAWSDVRNAGLIEHMDSLMALGQPIDVCLFKQVYDFFDGDGTTKEFVLQRRIADPTFATNPAVTWTPDYNVQLTRWSGQYGLAASTSTVLTVVLKASAAMDTGSPAAGEAWIEQEGHSYGNLLVTRVRLGTAPVSGPDVLQAAYVPYMRMIVESDSGRTYQQSMQESRGFKLTEQ